MSLTRKLKKFFSQESPRPYERLVNTNVKNADKYKAAGSVFTDGKIILAGYQPLKRQPFISGIGGKKEKGETYMQTAMRETLEELFEFKTIPSKLIEELKVSVIPQKVLQNGNYIIVLYTFKDLADMLKIINKYKLQTLLYDAFPMNLMERIFNRKLQVEFKPEISHLALLPLIEHAKADPFVNSFFVEDMPILMKHLE